MYRVGRLGAVRLVEDLSPVGQQIAGLHHRVAGLVKKRRVRYADGGRQGHHTRMHAHNTTHRVEGPCGRVLELVGAADGFGEGEQEVVVLLRACRDLLAGIERFLNNEVVVVSTASCGVCVCHSMPLAGAVR